MSRQRVCKKIKMSQVLKVGIEFQKCLLLAFGGLHPYRENDDNDTEKDDGDVEDED